MTPTSSLGSYRPSFHKASGSAYIGIWMGRVSTWPPGFRILLKYLLKSEETGGVVQFDEVSAFKTPVGGARDDSAV